VLLYSECDFHKLVPRNNADLGKGVPWQHVFHDARELLFFLPDRRRRIACSLPSPGQLIISKQKTLPMDALLLYSCVKYAISTNLFTETTQIWGKEFSGSMFSMMPENSSFFHFDSSPEKCRFAFAFHPPQRPSRHLSIQSGNLVRILRGNASKFAPVREEKSTEQDIEFMCFYKTDHG